MTSQGSAGGLNNSIEHPDQGYRKKLFLRHMGITQWVGRQGTPYYQVSFYEDDTGRCVSMLLAQATWEQLREKKLLYAIAVAFGKPFMLRTAWGNPYGEVQSDILMILGEEWFSGSDWAKKASSTGQDEFRLAERRNTRLVVAPSLKELLEFPQKKQVAWRAVKKVLRWMHEA